MNDGMDKVKIWQFFTLKLNLTLKVKVNHPKNKGILTKVFYTYGANLVILAWTGVELSRGQASDYRTHGRTDTQTDAGNDNTRRPKLALGKNPILNISNLKLPDVNK